MKNISLSKVDSLFYCIYSTCPIAYNNFNHLKRHMKSYNHSLLDNAEILYKCPLRSCNSSFPTLQQALSHLKSHKEDILLSNILLMVDGLKCITSAPLKESEPLKEKNFLESNIEFPIIHYSKLNKDSEIFKILKPVFKNGFQFYGDEKGDVNCFCRVPGCGKSFGSTTAYKYHCKNYFHSLKGLYLVSPNRNTINLSKLEKQLQDLRVQDVFLLKGITQYSYYTPEHQIPILFSINNTQRAREKNEKKTEYSFTEDIDDNDNENELVEDGIRYKIDDPMIEKGLSLINTQKRITTAHKLSEDIFAVGLIDRATPTKIFSFINEKCTIRLYKKTNVILEQNFHKGFIKKMATIEINEMALDSNFKDLEVTEEETIEHVINLQDKDKNTVKKNRDTVITMENGRYEKVKKYSKQKETGLDQKRYLISYINPLDDKHLAVLFGDGTFCIFPPNVQRERVKVLKKKNIVDFSLDDIGSLFLTDGRAIYELKKSLEVFHINEILITSLLVYKTVIITINLNGKVESICREKRNKKTIYSNVGTTNIWRVKNNLVIGNSFDGITKLVKNVENEKLEISQKKIFDNENPLLFSNSSSMKNSRVKNIKIDSSWAVKEAPLTDQVLGDDKHTKTLPIFMPSYATGTSEGILIGTFCGHLNFITSTKKLVDSGLIFKFSKTKDGYSIYTRNNNCQSIKYQDLCKILSILISKESIIIMFGGGIIIIFDRWTIGV